jgi:threonine aldolase
VTDTLLVDLRSDTVTTPTPGMREAMAAAPVGDDVYGEDPTVNELEAHVAELLGHEAGLYCPSGSMANMLGVRVLVSPGQELLCDSLAHVVRAELGGHSVLGQVSTRTWAADRGRLDAATALAMAVPDGGPYLVSTAAFAVENTHNFGGGTVQPIEQLRALRAGAVEMGVAVHLDGARLWNAHVATGVPLAEYGAIADTVSVCLSKGLGAPVGSVLTGSAERVAAARVWRKRYGGGMRQVGILAAAGRYALDHQLTRLADDHARARRLAGAVAAARPELVDVDDVETNIVVLDLARAGAGGPQAPEIAAAAREHGVLLSVLGPRTLRLVTHLGVDDEGCEHAAAVLEKVLG